MPIEPEVMQGYTESRNKELADAVNQARKEEQGPKFFKWTVEFEIEETWVADGAYSRELKARVIGKPDANEIRKAQGYHD